jgi:SAM-dependent methyltransferase
MRGSVRAGVARDATCVAGTDTVEADTWGEWNMKINVGCGRNILPGWVNIDRITHPEVLCADLNECATIPLPLPSDSADEILLSHVIEHIPNALPLMQELHRIAMPGAKVTMRGKTRRMCAPISPAASAISRSPIFGVQTTGSAVTSAR